MTKDKKTKRIKSVDSMFREMARDRKKHPIYYFFHDIYYRIVRFCEYIPREIKTFIQRGKRGWAHSDTWGFDYYLSKVIYKALRHFKDNIHGMPNNLTEGQWIDILNEISYAFELAHRCTKDELYLIRDKKIRMKCHSCQEEFDKINKELQKYKSHSRCMTYNEIIAYDKGWKLFKEYFFNLWD